MDIAYVVNPNHLGEELRDKVFIRNNKRDLGGFNTFALTDDFQPLSSIDPDFNKITDLFVRVFPTTGDKAALLSKSSFSRAEYARNFSEIKNSIKVYTNDEVTVAWFWENGEGFLLFAYGNKAVINLDSRREAGWQWVVW